VSLLLTFTLAALIAREPAELFGLPERRRRVAKYADCVVKILPDTTTRIALQTGSEMRREHDFQNVKIAHCLPGTNWMLMADRAILQFAFADALVRSKRLTLPADLSILKPLNQGPSGPAIARSVMAKGKRATEAETAAAVRAPALAELSRLGECVVRASPGGAKTLLQSEVASPDEDAAFAALSRSLGSCIDRGKTVSLSKDLVRGAIAFNYLRFSMAASAPQGVAK